MPQENIEPIEQDEEEAPFVPSDAYMQAVNTAMLEYWGIDATYIPVELIADAELNWNEKPEDLARRFGDKYGLDDLSESWMQ